MKNLRTMICTSLAWLLAISLTLNWLYYSGSLVNGATPQVQEVGYTHSAFDVLPEPEGM